MNAPIHSPGSWRPDPGAVAALAAGEHGDPFALLGMHVGPGALVSVRVFWPGAEKATVIERETGEPVASLELLHPAGFFAGPVESRRQPFPYRLRLEGGGASWEAEDPYRFPPVLGSLDVYLVAEGSHRRVFERLGAHPCAIEGVDGVAFAVWAPNARRVSVVGEFNQWDGRRHPMRKRIEAGIWEIFLPGAAAGQLYKFEIIGADGQLLPLKSDPVGFEQEAPPSTASRIVGPPGHRWSDAEWMAQRQGRQALGAPVSIYEVHLGSWRRKDGDLFLSYGDLTAELVPYVKDLGFTH
ncbi:MAG: 1,4-alpha-glucan branching enzyme, partial [Pseudomonadota bacterium]|nr:1,4-alpha-glucan branching enzyme [Pseudomonadota bacterium]